MTSMHGSDVVISGAGIGGSFLALLLGRAGRRVVVLERGTTLQTRGAEFLKPRGLRMLDEVGLLDRLLERGARRRSVIRYYHDGELLRHFDYEEHTELGYYLIIQYKDIVETIVEASAELPNVEVRFGAGIEEVELDHTELRAVTTADGQRFDAPAFVAASGSESSLSCLVAPEPPGSRGDNAIYTTTLPLLPSVLEYNRLYFSSTGWFAYFYPLAGETRVFVGAHIPPTDKRAGVIVERLAPFVTESTDVLAVLRSMPELEFHPVPVSAGQAPRYHRGNVALLGNAAWTCHPMTGQGMSVTMEDAQALADVLVEGDAPLPSLLAERYAPRGDLHRDLIAYGDGLARSYHDREAYERQFDPTMQGGDVWDRAAVSLVS